MEQITTSFLVNLPQKISGSCGPLVLKALRTQLSAFDSPESFDPSADWARNFIDSLAKRDGNTRNAMQTRYFYKDAVTVIYKSWLAAGLIAEIPEIQISHQDHRNLVVDPGKIHYPLSDYQTLTSHVLAFVCGRTKTIIQPSLEKGGIFPIVEQSTLTQLLLILGGYCRHNPVICLNKMSWDDVHLNESMPYRIPNEQRTSYIWFQPRNLARLMVLCLKFRALSDQKKFDSTDLVFHEKSTTKALSARLDLFRQQLNIHDLHVDDLIEPTRLKIGALFQHNSCLAVITGQIPHQSVAASYVADFRGLKNIDPLPPFKKVAESSDALDLDKLWNDIPEISDIDKMADLEGQLNSKVAIFYSQVKTFFFKSDDPHWKSYLTSHAALAEPKRSDIIAYNLYWVFKWLLWMEENKIPKSSSSREAYYFDAMRFIHFFPHIPVENITTSAIKIFIHEGEFAKSSLDGTKTALRSFLGFLSQSGKTVEKIQFEKINVPRDGKPGGILTDEEINHAYENAKDPNTRKGIRLSQGFGLRIHEAGKSTIENIELEGEPFIVVEKSKRGKTGLVPAYESYIPVDLIKTAAESNLPFDDKRVSENFSSSVSQCNKEGGRKKYHWIRAKRLQDILIQYGWIAASVSARHASAITLCEYVHIVDLLAARRIDISTYQIHQNLHIPFSTLAALMSYTTAGMVGLFEDFNQDQLGQPILLNCGDDLNVVEEFPDGVGHPEENFILISEAYRLVLWAIANERYHKRGKGRN